MMKSGDILFDLNFASRCAYTRQYAQASSSRLFHDAENIEATSLALEDDCALRKFMWTRVA
jgi:hypothetical protein